MPVGGPSKIGTIDPIDTKRRVYVDENLKEVGAGSEEAAFVFDRAELTALKARREELGVGGDEAQRVHTASTKAALADAERRAAQYEAEAAALRQQVADGEKAAKADAKAAKADKE